MMNEIKVPMWFLGLGGLALVWNLFGVFAFYVELNMSALEFASLPAQQQVLYEQRPAWYFWVFGVAVIAGTLGALCLLLRNAAAVLFFSLSLMGVVLQHFYMFVLTDVLKVMGSHAIVLPLLVLSVAIVLLIVSRNARRKKWIS
jgi:hypothetical protein